jgi:hypothetical protein
VLEVISWRLTRQLGTPTSDRDELDVVSALPGLSEIGFDRVEYRLRRMLMEQDERVALG